MAKITAAEVAEKLKSAEEPSMKVPATSGGAIVPADMMSEFEADSGLGFENVTTKDIAIPYYGILQALSPQVKKGEKKIAGAEEGDIFNTVSQAVIKGNDGIIVVPCAFLKAWVEWVPRDEGGGFIEQHLTDAIMKETTPNDKGTPTLPNGHNIVETAYHYILRVYDNGAIERAIISMTSTQLKKSRRWLAVQMNIQIPVGPGRMINPPPYSHTYHLTTIGESKNDNSWFGWSIAQPKMITDVELYHKAREFAKAIKEGQVDIPPPPTTDEPAAAGATSAPTHSDY